MTRLGDMLVDVQAGFASGQNLSDGVFQVRMQNVTRDGMLDLSKRRRVAATPRQVERHSIHPDDVLFNSTNSPDLVGKSALFETVDEPTTFSNHFLRLRADSALLIPSYLNHYLQYAFQRGTFRAMAKTWVNQASVGRDRLLSLEIPRPSLADQQRISSILDRASISRRQRALRLQKLSDLIGSLVDKVSSTDSLPRRSLGEHLSFITSGSRGWAKYYSTSGTKFIRIQNVLRDELDLDDLAYVTAPATAESSRTSTVEGDVLLSITADLGRAAVVPKGLGEAHINQHLALLRVDGIDARYLSAYLSSPAGQNQIAGRNRAAVKAGLNFDDIRSLTIPLPSREAQNAFSAQAQIVDQMRARTRELASAHDELFASLQHRAFRGDL